MLVNTNILRHSFKRIWRRAPVSLSTYYPDGTHYFYGYPAGEDSGFLNLVPPKAEELVAARALSCAGSQVTVINFAATAKPNTAKSLLNEFALPALPTGRVIGLPAHIDRHLEGKARNDAIKASLKALVPTGSLVMAQPYMDANLGSLYQIPPQLSAWLNDKNNVEQYISRELMTKRIAVYPSGKKFAKAGLGLPLPCVIKVSSSSSGDGVYICQKPADLKSAVQGLGAVKGTILVEEFIKAKKNYGIHFGIPHNLKRPIDLLGVNEQLTATDGSFLGGDY